MHTEMFHTNDNDDNNKILVLIGTTCNNYESLPVIYSLAAAKCLNLSLHLRDTVVQLNKSRPTPEYKLPTV